MSKNPSKVYYLLKSIMPRKLYPTYLHFKYRKVMGIDCNLENPMTYGEKMQWAKLNRDNRALSRFADKIAVRDYVAESVGEEYLIPTIGGVYKSAEEIDFDSLPKAFVVKANHGSGFNLIVNDKDKLDIKAAKKKLNQWLNTKFMFYSLELQYEFIEPRLYIEKNLLAEGMSDLPDYKFFCFDGKVYCSYLMTDYVLDHSKGHLSFFDRDFKITKYHRADYQPIEEQPQKPENYDEMVRIAEKLSQGFSHVRVDLYDVKGKIYFGEMTFSTKSGYCKFVPEEFDKILGEQWDLSKGI